MWSRSFYAVPLGSFDVKVAAALPGHVCTAPNQDTVPLPSMQNTADEASQLDKRARFRNLIQLIRLTTTILRKGKGPKLQSEEELTSPYESRPYTYLDATARLLVRKNEIVAAAECNSFHKDDPMAGVSVMAQPLNVGMFTFCCGLYLEKLAPGDKTKAIHALLGYLLCK